MAFAPRPSNYVKLEGQKAFAPRPSNPLQKGSFDKKPLKK